MSAASDDVTRLLRDDEEVLWRAKPDPSAFYAGWALALSITATFLAVPAVGWAFLELGVSPTAFPAAPTAGGLAAVAIAAGLALRRAYALAEYVVTDDRVLRSGGIVGRDVSTVPLADVTDVDVTRSLIGKLFGTGQLAFQTAGGPTAGVRLACVRGPYEVLGAIEDARERARSSEGAEQATSAEGLRV